MTFTKTASAIVLSLGLVAGTAAAVSTGATAATVERTIVATAKYSNCTELNKDYRHGVSNRQKPKRWWIKRGATGKGAYKPRLYKKVAANLDRDKDNIACEK